MGILVSRGTRNFSKAIKKEFSEKTYIDTLYKQIKTIYTSFYLFFYFNSLCTAFLLFYFENSQQESLLP